MKKYLLMLLLICGCSNKIVRQEDLNSWEKRNVIELEKHNLYSSLQRDKRELPNGQYLLIYTEKRLIAETSPGCFGSSIGSFPGNGTGYSFGTSMCGDKKITEDNCVHQFVIEKNLIISYRVFGENCYTTCKNQPESNNCK